MTRAQSCLIPERHAGSELPRERPRGISVCSHVGDERAVGNAEGPLRLGVVQGSINGPRGGAYRFRGRHPAHEEHSINRRIEVVPQASMRKTAPGRTGQRWSGSVFHHPPRHGRFAQHGQSRLAAESASSSRRIIHSETSKLLLPVMASRPRQSPWRFSLAGMLRGAHRPEGGVGDPGRIADNQDRPRSFRRARAPVGQEEVRSPDASSRATHPGCSHVHISVD